LLSTKHKLATFTSVNVQLEEMSRICKLCKLLLHCVHVCVCVCVCVQAGVYTREKIENYKSLDAQVFFRSGWVKALYHHRTQKSNFIFKCDVRPSFRF